MERLRTETIILKGTKPKFKEIVPKMYNYCVAAKHIKNSILFELRQDFFSEDKTKPTDTDIYNSILDKPRTFEENGVTYQNHALDYPKNGIQQLIRKCKNDMTSFYGKIKAGQKVSLPGYTKKETFVCVLSRNDFTIQYYKTKNSTKHLKRATISKLSIQAKNGLFTKLVITPRKNKIEIPLPKGLLDVNQIQFYANSKNEIVLRLIYDDLKQNFFNEELLKNIKNLDDKIKKRKKKYKKITPYTKKLQEKKKLAQQKLNKKAKKSRLKRKYKKTKFNKKSTRYITIDPGKNQCFSMVAVDISKGILQSYSIPFKEYKNKVKHYTKNLESIISKKDKIIESAYQPKKGQSKEKPKGWKANAYKKLTKKQKEEFDSLLIIEKKLRLKLTKVRHDFCHKVSSTLVRLTKDYEVHKVVVGKNPVMKTKMKGRWWNQIPHSKIYDLMEYKLAYHGVNLIRQEESYTSQASFFDFDPLKKGHFTGIRKGSTYIRKNKSKVDSDVNGALNILRKYLANSNHMKSLQRVVGTQRFYKELVVQEVSIQ